MPKRVIVEGVRREQIDLEKLSYALWLVARAELEREQALDEGRSADRATKTKRSNRPKSERRKREPTKS